MINHVELMKIKQLLEALARKCKTEALYGWTREGIKIVEREMKEQKEIEKMIETYDIPTGDL